MDVKKYNDNQIVMNTTLLQNYKRFLHLNEFLDGMAVHGSLLKRKNVRVLILTRFFLFSVKRFAGSIKVEFARSESSVHIFCNFFISIHSNCKF